ncbi:MAG: hypothetical protein AB7O04_08270 [Hyphomonadaceae bacterium]
MDLKTFICETLCQIQEGVQEAIQRRKEDGGDGVINPDDSTFEQQQKKLARDVSFDVAITVSEGSENSGKGGLRVAGLGVGAETKGTKDRETVSRVQFVVPVVVPTTKVKTDQDEHNRAILAQRPLRYNY